MLSTSINMRKDNGISQFEFKYLVSYWLSHLNNMPTGNELKLLYHFKRNKGLSFTDVKASFRILHFKQC